MHNNIIYVIMQNNVIILKIQVKNNKIYILIASQGYLRKQGIAAIFFQKNQYMSFGGRDTIFLYGRESP